MRKTTRRPGEQPYILGTNDTEQLTNAEADAVSTAVEALLNRQIPEFTKTADGVFRRWLAKAQSIDIDLSMWVDNEDERCVLTITKNPTLLDWSRLRCRATTTRSQR